VAPAASPSVAGPSSDDAAADGVGTSDGDGVGVGDAVGVRDAVGLGNAVALAVGVGVDVGGRRVPGTPWVGCGVAVSVGG
jgi:hypothetical protein